MDYQIAPRNNYRAARPRVHYSQQISVTPQLVGWLQRSMNRLLGTHLVPSGNLTPHTIHAIRRMQASLNIPANGQIDSLLVEGVRLRLRERIPPPPPGPPPSVGPGPSWPGTMGQPVPGSIGQPRPGGQQPGSHCTSCGGHGGGCTKLTDFHFNKYALLLKHKSQVRHIAQKILHGGIHHITISGYADKIGTERYNYALGMNRAFAAGDDIIRHLHSQPNHPLKSLTIKFVSYGESRPISANRSMNRRVEICLGHHRR